MLKPKIYSMTAREMGKFCALIDKNLARGFIQPAKSSMVPCALKEKEGYVS